jgi:hypothetical protein
MDNGMFLFHELSDPLCRNVRADFDGVLLFVEGAKGEFLHINWTTDMHSYIAQHFRDGLLASNAINRLVERPIEDNSHRSLVR